MTTMDEQAEGWQRIPRIVARVLALGFIFLWGIRLLEHWNATNPDIAAMNAVVYWAIALLLAGLLAGLFLGWVKEWIGGLMILGFGGLYFTLTGHWKLWPLAFGTLFTGLIWANLGWINQIRAGKPNPPGKPGPGPEDPRPSSTTDL